MNRILPNFVYAFILTISWLGLSPVIFLAFVAELWPLIIRIQFPIGIFRAKPLTTLKALQRGYSQIF